MNKVNYLEIDQQYQDQRIDNFLICYLKGVPRSRIYRALRSGEVRINRHRIKAHYRLNEGDIMRIPPFRINEKTETYPPNRAISAILKENILYEDEGLLIINKPAGIAVHGGSGVRAGLIETLKQIRPDDTQLELVHRLDRDTSGCLMIAKKRSVLKQLHEQLRNNAIKKTYLALVEGHWPRSQQKVTAPLYKYVLASGERRVKVSEDGKDAITYFKPLNYFAGSTLVQAIPVTGRTHQIRVHAACCGCPIRGDQKYGSSDKRLYLHAEQLTLTHNQQSLTITAPHDETFSKVITTLKEQG